MATWWLWICKESSAADQTESHWLSWPIPQSIAPTGPVRVSATPIVTKRGWKRSSVATNATRFARSWDWRFRKNEEETMNGRIKWFLILFNTWKTLKKFLKFTTQFHFDFWHTLLIWCFSNVLYWITTLDKCYAFNLFENSWWNNYVKFS